IISSLVLVKTCNGSEFRVGGPGGRWAVPSDPNSPIYIQWAESNRFQIGDTLLFFYTADQDSVLQVTEDDYDDCNTTSPLNRYTDGHTAFKFNQSGPYYFISGLTQNCLKSEKLVVVVLADRSKKKTTAAPPPPAIAPVPPPSAAPAAAKSPPSPPEEVNPAPAPSENSSPLHNAA
ncbi:hypothetical protein M569_02727, partial [Genlisea aurea]